MEWKNSKWKKPLLVKGARQIGKTYIIREFGKQNYESYIELNFLLYPEHRKYFDGNLDVEKIISEISLDFENVKFINQKTLIFLDEIQDCGQARTALKSFAEDGRFDVIASGSMLGVAYKQTLSIPVGYESQVEMFAMDFEEYLWAIGRNAKTIDYVRDYFTKKDQVPNGMNDTMLKLLREYMIIGGMPAAVNVFIESSNFGEVHRVQTEIINSYLDDIAKYAPVAERSKARSCYLSLPRQLAKENKKFQFSVVEKDGTARKFDNSVEWLRDAGLVKLCNNVSTPEFPLAAYAQMGYYKIYASDIGILNAMYDFEIKKKIYNNTLKGSMKGGIYENLVADMLLKKNLPLFYYKPGENKQEIEFLHEYKGDVIPIEVKAGNAQTRSLDEFIKQFKPPYALKFITGNIGQVDTKITMPLYMAMFLKNSLYEDND